jgi:hypothetical protein
VPSGLRLMAYDVNHDPLFTVICAPLMRWAREIWLLSSHQKMPDDVLDGLTMHKAAQVIQGNKVHDITQGPIRAIASALNQLSWSLDQAHIIRMADSTIDLTTNSPAMLKHYIRSAYSKQRDQEATRCITARGVWNHDLPPAWPTIRRFLKSTKVETNRKEAILQLLYGTTPHSHWLWKHGWQIEPVCILCKKHVDNTHILCGCAEMPPPKRTYLNWSNSLIQKKVPPKLCTTKGCLCYLDGKSTDWKQFFFDSKQPIYTDGSAKHVQLPEIAVCSAAAWQIDSQGRHRVASFQVPEGSPQSAIMAEFMALAIAAKAIPIGEDNVHIVSDCQSAISAATSIYKVDHPNSKFAGILRGTGFNLIGKYSKVAAHQSLLRPPSRAREIGGMEMIRLTFGPKRRLTPLVKKGWIMLPGARPLWVFS